jgi:hypothetical protein
MQDAGSLAAVVVLNHYPAFAAASAEYVDAADSLYGSLEKGWNTLFQPNLSDL